MNEPLVVRAGRGLPPVQPHPGRPPGARPEDLVKTGV